MATTNEHNPETSSLLDIPSRARDYPSVVLRCIECRAESERGEGWRAYISDDEVEPAEVCVYCPACAAREFDSPEAHESGAD